MFWSQLLAAAVVWFSASLAISVSRFWKHGLWYHCVWCYHPGVQCHKGVQDLNDTRSKESKKIVLVCLTEEKKASQRRARRPWKNSWGKLWATLHHLCQDVDRQGLPLCSPLYYLWGQEEHEGGHRVHFLGPWEWTP